MTVVAEGPTILPPKISLYGLVGEFTPSGANARTVRYFQTLAAAAATGAGNTAHLLAELKPMRERVSVQTLKDPSVILHRELDDDRIAREMVPYLAGSTGFFPSVLAALMPKGFISGTAASYPAGVADLNNPNRVNYGAAWSYTNIVISGQATSLAMIEIDPQLTDIVVLDGQHRANAFRYMAGVFANDDGSIYSPLYKSAPPPPATFNAQLPVTVIWFERGGDPIDPNLISRRLFVDVNQQARRVDESRQILLDDRLASRVVTGLVYNEFAAAGTGVNELSLLHTGFDSVSDARRRSPFVLFLPEDLWSAIAFYATGVDDYHDVRPKNARRFVPRKQNDLDRLATLVDLDEPGVLAELDRPGAAYKEIRQRIATKLAQPIASLIRTNGLVRAHVLASGDVNRFVEEANSPTLTDVWRLIFLGGEGLLTAFRSREIAGDDSEQLLENPHKASMDTIEDKLREHRAIRCGFAASDVQTVDVAYRSLGTKASLVGLLMAASVAGEEFGWEEPLQELASRVQSVDPKDWVFILTDYRQAVNPKLEPADWPDMMRVYLRVLQSVDASCEVYREDRLTICPDVTAVLNEVQRRVKSWAEAQDGTPPEDVRTQWVEDAINSHRKRLELTHLAAIVSEADLRARAETARDAAIAALSPSDPLEDDIEEE